MMMSWNRDINFDYILPNPRLHQPIYGYCTIWLSKCILQHIALDIYFQVRVSLSNNASLMLFMLQVYRDIFSIFLYGECVESIV